jgi:hypothetical protein
MTKTPLERSPARLVATAEEDRLSMSALGCASPSGSLLAFGHVRAVARELASQRGRRGRVAVRISLPRA